MENKQARTPPIVFKHHADGVDSLPVLLASPWSHKMRQSNNPGI